MRLTGRAPLLLSAAAVTVAALAVGGAVALDAGRRVEHHTPPELGPSIPGPTPTSPTASPSAGPGSGIRRTTTAHQG